VDGSPLILELGLDITARRRAEQALRESEERLRFLANQLLTSQEQERKRLASELHDELGHALLTLKLSLGAIARKLLPEQENVKELIQEQLEYISHVIEEVRRLYYDLSPGDLEDLGLTKALESLVEDFGSHQPDISFHVDLPELTGGVSLPVQTIIYRLVQEALTNIGKHAEPTQVNVSAQKENGRLCLVIEDDGEGFDLSEVVRDPKRGLGLAAMRERLYIVGGSLEIWSRPGGGTRLTFTIPTLPEGA
jgi:signal transduction histidine kinase